MRRLIGLACVAVAVLSLSASRADAQIPGLISVVATSRMEFDASADHGATKLDGTAVVASYRVDYYLLDAGGNIPATAAPAFSTNLGKPTPVSNVIVVPNAFGALIPNTAYRVKVAAVGPDGAGVSPASVPFGKVDPKLPAAPPVPRIVQ